MKGLWLEHGLSFREQLPRPELRAHEALVRVSLAGVCSTDLELVRGYQPFVGVPGHEFVGVIEKAPSAPERVGQRVVGAINAVCGRCDLCRRGMSLHCRSRTVLGIVGRNGAFAEYLTLPAENLHPVDDAVADEAAVFCEPLAAAFEVIEQRPMGVDERVLLVGAGRLGQLLARVLARTGCQLDVMARHPRKRQALDGVEGVRLLETIEEPASYDVVVEASGSAAGFAVSRRALRPRGTLVLKSTFAGNTEVDLASVVVDEITLIGSRCGPMEKALAALADKSIDPTVLIDERLPLERGVEAFEVARRREVIKVLLQPEPAAADDE